MDYLFACSRFVALTIALLVPQVVIRVGMIEAEEVSWRVKWERTIAAAKRTGVVRISGPPQQAPREVIMMFQKEYPDIKLKYSGLRGRDFIVRARAERRARMYLWDVVIGGVGNTTYEAASKGWFQALKPALILPEVLDDSKWLGGFDAGFGDKKKRYVYGFAAYLAHQCRHTLCLVDASAKPCIVHIRP